MATSVGNTRVFIDANILLEVILNRPRQRVARQLLADNPANRYISALTGHLVMHFGSNIATFGTLQAFLADYTLLPLDESNFKWAFTNTLDNDFEDALQLAVATAAGCGRFVTFDQELYKHYRGNVEPLKIELLA